MTKRTFTFLLASLFLFKGFAQQVEQVQRSLITKRTATWCPNCGTWGWTLFENLQNDNGDKAVYLAAHYSGDLMTSVAEEMTDNFGALYQPAFYFNSQQGINSSGSASAIRTNFQQMADAAFLLSPVANAGLDVTYDDAGMLTVKAKTKFFQAADGEFYLAVYLVENNVIGYQASLGANANHQRVLRASFSGNTWGELLKNGSIASNEEFLQTFSLPGDPTGKDYEFVGVIWQKNGNKYNVVNTWSTNEVGTASATGEIKGNFRLTVSPTVAQSQATVKVGLKQNLENADLEVLDLNGKLVRQVFSGALEAGEHTFIINGENVVPGLYFVKFASGEKVSTSKVIFQ